MHGHVDTARRHVEQTARFDDFKPLVHQRGRVDGHHRTHIPSRVVQRLFRRDVGHLLAFPTAERTSGSGDHEFRHFTVRARTQRLPDGGMFGINRIDLLRTNLCVEQQMTAGHNGFLVGERQLRSCLQCRNRRFKADGSGNAVQHHVGTGSGHGDYRFRPGHDFHMACAGLV